MKSILLRVLTSRTPLHSKVGDCKASFWTGHSRTETYWRDWENLRAQQQQTSGDDSYVGEIEEVVFGMIPKIISVIATGTQWKEAISPICLY